MNCQKCGNVIVEGAVFCTKCGSKVQSEEANSQISHVSANANDTNTRSTADISTQMPAAKPKKPITKKWWFWGIIVVVAIIVISSLGGDSEDTDIATGNETMSAADIYVWIAANDELGYNVPEEAVSFMENNPQFFPGSDKNTGAMSDHIDYEADYPHIAKSPSKYADKLVSIYGDISDCEEIETDYGTVTYLHIIDYSGYSYCMYYLGTLEDAFEGYSAWANVLPFGTITFENVGGYYTEAVIGAACYVEVENYDNYDGHL